MRRLSVGIGPIAMGQGLAGRGAASGPAIVAGKRSGRAITQAKAKAGSQEATNTSGAQTSLADVNLLSAPQHCSVHPEAHLWRV